MEGIVNLNYGYTYVFPGVLGGDSQQRSRNEWVALEPVLEDVQVLQVRLHEILVLHLRMNGAW